MTKFCLDDEKSDTSASIIAYQQIPTKAGLVSPSLSNENCRKFQVCGENDIYNRKVIYARSLKDLIRKGED